MKVVFDLYGTLFDIESVKNQCEKLFPGHGEKIAKAWNRKIIEYIQIRQLVNKYKDYRLVVKDALEYVLEKNEFDCTNKKIAQCMEAFDHLDAFSSVTIALNAISKEDKYIFSNGNKKMIENVIRHSELNNDFSDIIAIEGMGVYKPSPQSFDILQNKLPELKDDILYVSSNKWNIIAAHDFGYKTAWINRTFIGLEHFDITPDYEFQSFTGLLNLYQGYKTDSN